MNFIRRPYLWLDAIHRFRGTITFAPNFAYALSARAVKQAQSQDWDLSCLKAMGCGAEPIEADVLRSFVGRFAENGLSPRALLPCYGLAEATLAVTFADLESSIATEAVCPEGLKQGKARAANGHGAIEVVSCGKAFPGHELRVVGDDGQPLADGVVGHIHLRGPSVTAGYFEAPEASAEVFLPGGWLATGDLGYLRKGELFVCGRAKDLIIINGKNFYPQDIERIAAAAYGVRQDQVVAFARRSMHGTSEECVVVAEGLKVDTDAEEITRTIKQRVRSELSLDVAEVVMIERGSMPKTSSGKVRRRETKQRLDQGTLELLRTAPVKRKAPAPRPSAPAMS
jgi:fatty-acyl-CoA synthase